ncbi:tick legumain [Sarcoptes scabiei]|nr:tick legumain [Sarcoptes scabiei]
MVPKKNIGCKVFLRNFELYIKSKSEQKIMRWFGWNLVPKYPNTNMFESIKRSNTSSSSSSNWLFESVNLIIGFSKKKPIQQDRRDRKKKMLEQGKQKQD